VCCDKEGVRIPNNNTRDGRNKKKKALVYTFIVTSFYELNIIQNDLPCISVIIFRLLMNLLKLRHIIYLNSLIFFKLLKKCSCSVAILTILLFF